ncbi:trigger factor [Spirulina sp. CS-785/01]|uniref:trigger factor n=1 Tax=Spirulina sp. CS-785/01 TaxID=3021716 RepID=UPI00233019CA|nr:trigger factor [Spirulina sp. CS-785/01]MDB9312006.1 trigger factor [Spirulina sp. CS-785/01]
MKVTQETLPASKIGLEIEIPADKSKQVYEKVIKELSRSVRLPGFRQGKVPRHILLQRIGPDRVKAEALEKLIQDGLEQAVEQEKINVLGNYQLISDINELIQTFKPGEPLTFSASMDVPPQPQVGDYKGLSVTAEKKEYDPSQVDEFLDSQRSQMATLVPVEDRRAQRGDVVMVDYQGQLKDENGGKGEVISGAEATDFQLELESGKFLEDLIEGIVGMKPEEMKEIPVQFPEDYAREDLAGVEAIFTVTLHEVKEKELPELDDEFAEEASEFETMAELREHLEKQYQEQAEEATKGNVEAAITDALLKIVQVELPDTMVDRETDVLVQQTAMQMQQYGLDIQQMMSSEIMPQLKENARPEAEKRLKASLALQKIAETESLEVDSEAVEKRVGEIVEQMRDRQLDMDRVREFVNDELKEETALNWLRENITVELVPEGTLSQEAGDEEGEAEASEPEGEAVEAEVEVVEEE